MRSSVRLALFIIVAGIGDRAHADASAVVQYAPPAKWVLPPPTSTDTPSLANSPLRVVYNDTQVHVDGSGTETYSSLRVRILKPEGLPIGNLTIEWNPASGSATVHAVRIWRQGQMIDVLRGARFQVIQRETALEAAAITGNLTAMLQVPGLQLGDELEVADTIRSHDPSLGIRGFGQYQMPVLGLPGAFGFRLTWTPANAVNWRATRDLPAPVPASVADGKAIAITLRDPAAVVGNDGAPARYNVRRLIEYSSFASWRQVSEAFAPLFARTEQLAPDSPLRAEIARISAASPDPKERAKLALQLVEDQVRYVYVGLNGVIIGQPQPTRHGVGALATARPRPHCCWPCCKDLASKPNRFLPTWSATTGWISGCPILTSSITS